ncbi:hypothetical protein NE237_016742 [Protea cynaroides]|uniref:ADP-ribosyl cyclase/cyclic ADP-ribose hydrolase n=1 Tax=Protea cynaroides TaxID=273540 RepID=A0A9Q0K737_9MAGN|nr:hypothetical protein NE237_016742 [Protea cynaroides]
MYYYSMFGFLMNFLVIIGGVLLLSVILIKKFYKKRTVISAGEESTAAPLELVSSHTTSSSTNGRRYDVFLNFRGEDTRTKFTDHLYTALVDAGINTFRDDNEIRMGEEIGSELLTAIQQSRISITVFSEKYAFSKWCLIELTKIVECREKTGQIVLPIFYHVEPSDVRYQRGTYATAFSKHKKRFDMKTVEGWKEALRVAGDLKGVNVKNRHEAELIKSVVTMVLSELKKTSLVTTDYLVGIQYHVKEILKLLNVSSMEVRIVGIHGMGGIGKTTIARAIYNEIFSHFENCTFLEDVRETFQQHKGLVQLQKQLISNILKWKDVDITNVDEGVNMIKQRCCNKKVLIVLDDVDNLYQLRALANKRDWFGLGSRIIITTRDKHILNEPEVDKMYEPGELDCNQSLTLFSMHAFRRDRPPDDYYDLSSAVAHTAGGLPLALEVLGSYLSGKHKAVWEDALKKLEKIPHEQVQKKLRISYDELDYEQKQIFLDTACYFIGMNKRIATYIWDDCKYFPQEGIDVLLLRSLVKIGDNDEMRMHSQLRDLGREIVRRESFEEPGERSRLWFHDDVWEVLKTHTGTRKVEGLRLDFGNGLEANFLRKEEFAEMSKLRLLQIDYAIIAGDFKHFLSKLRWLRWKGCPYNFAPTNFLPEKLIVLDLSWSRVTEDWEGWNQIKMAKKLKVIDLSGCCDLIKTPNFLAFPSLERLVLEDCSSLVEIDSSIGYLKCLVFLNAKNCKSLVDLPISFCGLNSLESLIVSGCTKLSRLPTGLGSLKALRELRIDETSIGQFSDSIALPKKLEILSARDCGFLTVLPTLIGQLRFLTDLALDKTQIVVLPDSIGSLLKLQCLSLHDCTSLRKIPDSIGKMESLIKLNLIGTAVTEIPDSVGQLKSLIWVALGGSQIIELPDSIGLLAKLELLSLCECSSLRTIPDSIGRLESVLKLDLGRTGITEIPDAIGELKSLTDLRLAGTQIIEIPESVGLLSMLERLSLYECVSLRMIPDSIGRLESLLDLNLDGTRITEIPDAIGELKSLTDLNLGRTQIIEIPDSIGLLMMLESLSLQKCVSLRRIPDSIGRLESLLELNLVGTRITEIPVTVGHLKSLVYLKLDGTQITDLPNSIGSLSKLELLSLSHCRLLGKIPDSIGRLESLSDLNLNTTGITDIPDAIGNLRNLQELCIDKTTITQFPCTIAMLGKLCVIDAWDCCIARGEIPSDIGKLSSLERLTLWSKNSFILPESISSLPLLDFLHIKNCRNHPSLPDLPSSLSILKISSCTMETLPKLSNLTNLYDLTIGDCENLLGIPSDIGKLSNLINLTRLSIYDCKKLQCFPHLPSGLCELSLSSCMSVESLPDLPNLKRVYDLRLSNFFNQTEIQGLERMELLTSLNLSGCRSMERLPDMSTMKKLESLILRNCEKLCDIEGLERLELLKRLDMSGCMSLERLPILSNLKMLKELCISNCKKLIEIQGINELKSLKRLYMNGCISMERLPDVSKLKALQVFEIRWMTLLLGNFQFLKTKCVMLHTAACLILQILDMLMDNSMKDFNLLELQKGFLRLQNTSVHLIFG